MFSFILFFPTDCDPESKVSSKGKATRARPSNEQKELLLQAFAIQPYPNKEQIYQLADSLGFKAEKVKQWFRNRRKAEKKRQVMKLRELDDLASSLLTPNQPVSQAQPLLSFSYRRFTPVPVSYPGSATTRRNHGLVLRSQSPPMPYFRRAVQKIHGQMVPAYKSAHAPRHMPLESPSPSLRSVYSYKVPVVCRFQVWSINNSTYKLFL